MKKTSKYFTLIELLVVITILAILISLMQPALINAIYKARVVKCSSNLKGIAAGVFMYADDYYDNYVEGRRHNTWSIPNTASFNAFGQYFNGENNNYLDATPRNPAWLCPQAAVNIPWKAKTANSNKSTYALYPNYSTNWGWGTYESLVMKRLGDPLWLVTHVTSTGTITKFKYNIIASDVCQGGNNGKKLMTNHLWKTDFEFGLNNNAWHGGASPLYFHSASGVSVSNYAFDDGSVKTYGDFSYSTQAIFFHKKRPVGSDWDLFLLPKEWAE